MDDTGEAQGRGGGRAAEGRPRVEPLRAEPPPGPEGDLAAAAEEVGDRWTLVIAGALLDGPRRFGDLQRALPEIAPNILVARLRRMTARGLVTAEPYSRRPPRVVYELTAAGRELAPALRALAAWGARGEGGPRHELCGTPLEVRLWCPVCRRHVEDAGEPEELHHL
ncbi:MAG TPA: helix-turn-helix domain-containing protein [Miltoncostaeaceae bacterium]|nr:helix-turn-helix domain-containing protein [Miltoncostaeaceae bacterium]